MDAAWKVVRAPICGIALPCRHLSARRRKRRALQLLDRTLLRDVGAHAFDFMAAVRKLPLFKPLWDKGKTSAEYSIAHCYDGKLISCEHRFRKLFLTASGLLASSPLCAQAEYDLLLALNRGLPAAAARHVLSFVACRPPLLTRLARSDCNIARPSGIAPSITRKIKLMALSHDSFLCVDADACASLLRCMSSEPVSQTQRPAPRGRPPKGYIWCGDGYVHRSSLAPYSREEHEALMLDLWRHMWLLRYRADARGFRTRRIETQAKAHIAKGIKPRRPKLKNTTLAPSPAEEVTGGTDK